LFSAPNQTQSSTITTAYDAINEVNMATPSRRNTVSDLFAALEDENIVMLRQIAKGVKTFDRYV